MDTYATDYVLEAQNLYNENSGRIVENDVFGHARIQRVQMKR